MLSQQMRQITRLTQPPTKKDIKNEKHFRNQATCEGHSQGYTLVRECLTPSKSPIMQERRIRHGGDKRRKEKETWKARKLLAAGVDKAVALAC